jgi:hypothetical protein
MAKSSSQGDILHFGAVRLRVIGVGELDLSLHSLDEGNVSTLVPYDMTPSITSYREKVILANYIDQRGQLVLSTDSKDEIFEISKIVIFVKQLYTGYPQ